jgi:hypothetical protein
MAMEAERLTVQEQLELLRAWVEANRDDDPGSDRDNQQEEP